MRHRLRFICIAFMVAFAGFNANPQTERDGAQLPGQTDYDTVFTVQVDRHTKPLQFHVCIASVQSDSLGESIGWRDRFYHITIGQPTLHDTVQQIDEYSFESLPLLPLNEMFKCEDINFDGYLDFRYLVSRGATGNASFVYWIYRPDTNVFRADYRFSDLVDPSPKPDTKEIITSYRCGWGCYGVEVFRFEAGQLIKDRYVAMNYSHQSGDSLYSTVERGKLVNGKMSIIGKRVCSEDEAYEELGRP